MNSVISTALSSYSDTTAMNSAINTKQATIDNTNRLHASLIADGSVDNTEFQYLNGVTFAIQPQIDALMAV
eukprot:6005169-Prymnesium_polylepis.1